MGFFSKLLRTANHLGAVQKDVKMVANLTVGDKAKGVKRVKNKAKGKIARKVFKSLKF